MHTLRGQQAYAARDVSTYPRKHPRRRQVDVFEENIYNLLYTIHGTYTSRRLLAALATTNHERFAQY